MVQHFHTRLLDWSLTTGKSMKENVCLDLENTLPKLTGVVTWEVKMQETLWLLTRQSIWYWVKESMALGYSRQASTALAKVPLFFLACLIPARTAGLRMSLWYKQFATAEEKDSSETWFSETLQKRFQELVPEEGLSPLRDWPHHNGECARNKLTCTKRRY